MHIAQLKVHFYLIPTQGVELGGGMGLKPNHFLKFTKWVTSPKPSNFNKISFEHPTPISDGCYTPDFNETGTDPFFVHAAYLYINVSLGVSSR